MCLSISRHRCCSVPLPDEAKSRPPGAFFAVAITSASVLSVTDVVDHQDVGHQRGQEHRREILVVVERELGIERRVHRERGGVVQHGVAVGSALAAAASPMVPPAPPRLSMTNCSPHSSPSFGEQDPADGVGAAGRRIGHDHPHRPGRPVRPAPVRTGAPRQSTRPKPSADVVVSACAPPSP